MTSIMVGSEADAKRDTKAVAQAMHELGADAPLSEILQRAHAIVHGAAGTAHYERVAERMGE